MSSKPIFWLGMERQKPNIQQKHAFNNQNKCTTTQNKHKTLKQGLVASYDIWPGNGESLFWFQRLLRHLHTYLQPGPTRGIWQHIIWNQIPTDDNNHLTAKIFHSQFIFQYYCYKGTEIQAFCGLSNQHCLSVFTLIICRQTAVILPALHECNYLHQEGCCLSVCLLATLRKNFWTDLH